MADGIKISIEKVGSIENIQKKLTASLDKLLDKHAHSMATKAKQKVHKDEGTLANSISADVSKPLEKYVKVNAPYAAFVEFGTGKYAAAYVSGLPEEWRTYAAQFKGQKGGGSFDEMVKNIAAWIHRKGLFADTALHGTYSVKTKRRTGNKIKNASDDMKLAYVIARSILKKGVHQHPFLYPAYLEVLQDLSKDLQNLSL